MLAACIRCVLIQRTSFAPRLSRPPKQMRSDAVFRGRPLPPNIDRYPSNVNIHIICATTQLRFFHQLLDARHKSSPAVFPFFLSDVFRKFLALVFAVKSRDRRREGGGILRG